MYSNGINISEVLTVLNGRLGWRQGTLSGVPTLSSANLGSVSGRYFNDFHSLITMKNIKDTIEDSAITDDQFNTLLQDKQKSVILKVLQDVFNQTQSFEQHLLFDRLLGSQDQLTSNSGKFVGWKIKPCSDPKVAIQIDSLSLLFNGDKTFNIYLYHDSQPIPLKTKSVTVQANTEVHVDLDDWYCSFINEDTKGGVYYIGYFQDDLSDVKAYSISPDYFPSFCFSFDTFYCNHSGSVLETQQYGMGANPYGLNLQVSAFKDFTNQAIRNKTQFDNAIGLGMAVEVLRDMVYTIRSNSGERGIQEHLATAEYELTGSVPVAGTSKKVGLVDKYTGVIETLQKSFHPQPKAQTVSIC